MDEERSRRGRYFLKDHVRKETDFSGTDQNRGLPPPPMQKPCPPEVRRVTLPDGAEAVARLGGMPLGEAILRRESVRSYSDRALTLEELSAMLWATQGLRGRPMGGSALRTVPSAGARHAFETYLAVSRVEGLEPGLYRYLPFDGELALLSADPDIGRRSARACLGQRFVAGAAAVFFWTTLPARMEWRYGEASYKVIALDCGHVCQNLYLICGALEAGTCAVAAYDQDLCDDLLGVDGEDEFTIYVAPVGKLP